MLYYQMHIGDFIKDTAHLSLLEEAIYRRLIDFYYKTEKPINLDLKLIARHIRARENEETISLILSEFFEKNEKGYMHKRIEKDINSYREKSEKASKSAKKRWDKTTKDSSERIANASDIDANACKNDTNAMRTHNERNANAMLTNNHKPITNNQYKDKGKKTDADKSSTRNFKKPVFLEVYNFMVEKGLSENDAEKQANMYINYYESVGWIVGKKKMKVWKAAATNWISRANNYEINSRNNKQNEINIESTGWADGIEQEWT